MISVERNSACGESLTGHCWHYSGITLTSYPGYQVMHCCYCGSQYHEPITPPDPAPSDHGPYMQTPHVGYGSVSKLGVRRDEGGTE